MHLSMLAFLSALIVSCLGSPINAADFASAITVRAASQQAFSCDQSNRVWHGLCNVALNKLNAELNEAGLSLNRDDFLFVYDDPRDTKHGKQCTASLTKEHVHAEARITHRNVLSFHGNSLAKPFAIRIKLPVRFSARIDLKQRWGFYYPHISGFRIRKKCKNVGSDSFALKSSLSTTADVVVGFNLNPSLSNSASGDYVITIKPQVAVMSKLHNTDLDFEVSGANPIGALYTTVVSLKSSLASAISSALSGDDWLRELEGNLAWDIGSSVVLGIGSLPATLERFIWGQITPFAERYAARRARGFGANVEEKLHDKMKRALNLNAQGVRQIVIRRNFLHILDVTGANANVIIARGSSQSNANSQRPQSMRDICYQHAHSVCQNTCGIDDSCGECGFYLNQCDRMGS